MSQDVMPEKAQTVVRPQRPEKVVLRSYPKIVLLYPTWFMAMIAAVVTGVWLQQPSGALGMWFIIIASLNLVVLSFEFPRTTSFTLVFLIVAVILGALWLNDRWEFFPFLAELWGRLEPQANAWFYGLLAFVLSVIYVFVFLDTRFDYWEIMPNEIIHHHGVLGNVNRFPAPQLKLEKEITDVFEFMLLRSGRLLIHPSTERRAIVLENVPNINRREEQIQSLLRVLDVHVHTGDEAAEEH